MTKAVPLDVDLGFSGPRKETPRNSPICGREATSDADRGD